MNSTGKIGDGTGRVDESDPSLPCVSELDCPLSFFTFAIMIIVMIIQKGKKLSNGMNFESVST